MGSTSFLALWLLREISRKSFLFSKATKESDTWSGSGSLTQEPSVVSLRASARGEADNGAPVTSSELQSRLGARDRGGGGRNVSARSERSGSLPTWVPPAPRQLLHTPVCVRRLASSPPCDRSAETSVDKQATPATCWPPLGRKRTCRTWVWGRGHSKPLTPKNTLLPVKWRWPEFLAEDSGF